MRIGVEQSQNRRHVPLGIKLLVLFGGDFNQIGWLLFGLFTLMLWQFIPATGVLTLLAFQQPLGVTNGVVTGWRESEEYKTRDTTTYSIAYTYEVGHNQYRGESYADGMHHENDEVVTVEYVPAKPALSRIQGLRHSVLSPESLVFALCFAYIGATFFVPQFIAGMRSNRLLQAGMVGKGRFHRREVVRRRTRRQFVYRVFFEFIDPMGETRYVSGYTTNIKPEWEQESNVEQILYYPDDPSKAIIPHCLPGMPVIDEQGGVNVRAAFDGYVVIIIPAFVVLGHLGMALSRLFMG